jgi:hypothetical protein
LAGSVRRDARYFRDADSETPDVDDGRIQSKVTNF